jgi:hypothetical protein
VTALAPLAHWSGAGEGDMLDMCGVGVEATWTAREAVATAWACHQCGVAASGAAGQACDVWTMPRM